MKLRFKLSPKKTTLLKRGASAAVQIKVVKIDTISTQKTDNVLPLIALPSFI